MQPIGKFRKAVHGRLATHELDGDTAFYTQEEWRARGEDCLADAILVLVFEGGLYNVVNGDHADSTKLYGDFERFVLELGYCFEFGHAWSMGFYPLPAPRLNAGLRIYTEPAGA